MTDHKEGARRALNKFFGKQAAKLDREMNGPKRKNERPEFEKTVKPVKKWADECGWSVDIVESRAVYSHDAGRYLDGQTIAGFPDIVGCNNHGHCVYIECKAPKNWRGLQEHQREFLLKKIERGAFAVCVESVVRLEKIYAHWIQLPTPQARAEWLTGSLPPKVEKRKTSPGMCEDLGF